MGECPICGTDHFYCNPKNNLWDCKKCSISGNLEKFLELMMDLYTLDDDPLSDLAIDRGLTIATLKAWGVGYSKLSGKYMIPVAGNSEGRLVNILCYNKGGKALSTSRCRQDFSIPKRGLTQSETVYLCEGCWDGMALFESLGAKAEKVEIISTPGAGVFPIASASIFEGKFVRTLYDNDPAGKQGSRRAQVVLNNVAKKVRYLHWPKDRKSGWDIRDEYKERKEELLEFIEANLKDTLPGDEATPASSTDDVKEPDPNQPPPSHIEVSESYRKWLSLKDDEVISVVFGAVFANLLRMEPIWMFLVGPPGSGKSAMLQTLADSSKVKLITTLTPASLISGSHHPGVDHSLIPQLNGKVLIVKDFSAILKLNLKDRDQIFGILRDAYDGSCQRALASGIRSYKSRFGLIAGATAEIEKLVSANGSLGERFIRYKLREQGRIVVASELIQMALSSLTNEEQMQHDLSQTALSVLNRVCDKTKFRNKLTQERALQFQYLAQWVSNMRAVVSREPYTNLLSYKPSAEIGTRLARQFCTLAYGISIYKGDEEITDDTMNTIRHIAIDTSPDRAEEIIKQIYVKGCIGIPPQPLSVIEEWTRLPSNTVYHLLNDLNMLGLVKKINPEEKKQEMKWDLSDSFRRLTRQAGLYAEEVKYANEIHNAVSVVKSSS